MKPWQCNGRKNYDEILDIDDKFWSMHGGLQNLSVLKVATWNAFGDEKYFKE